MADAFLSPGSTIGGDFVVLRPIDEGGMGAVYLVEQRSTGKRRALKVMRRDIVADATLLRRFEREARVGSLVRSEHVVEVLAAGVDADTRQPYLVMELLEGEDLRQRIDRCGPMSPDEVRLVFEQLCHAMGAAHAAGVVHRDLKPENIFLARSRRAGGGPFVVKVLDFGIARLVAEAGTRATRGAVGSPMWMAPEQTTPGEVTAAADVWAMGLLAYELFTGKTFWRSSNEAGATTAQLLREIVLDPIPLATERADVNGLAARLPGGFDIWFARSVAREPGDRFADAGAAWRAMQTLFPGSPSLAETVLEPSSIPPPSKLPAETGESTPYIPLPNQGPGASGVLHETPVATVQRATPPPGAVGWASGRSSIWVGAAVAIAGISVGWGLSRRAPVAPGAATPATATTVAAMLAGGASATVVAPPAVESATTTTGPPAPAVPTARSAMPPASAVNGAPVAASSSPPAAGAASTKPAATGESKGAVWKVGDRQVRLAAHLVSNQSNVSDAVVRKAVEWDSWEYLRCYEQILGGLKDLPDGTVTVGFDILDQLPRHAALQSSTISSPQFNECVVHTLLGQTINAAGPDGAGHVVYAFRFVPN
jgi:eukaryotic-like serine/threonine-protein kinase